jgi:hypothetical protein
MSYAEQSSMSPKSWTLLIYHNGDDGYANEEDPDDFGGVYYDIEDQIKSLEKIGSTDQVNVVIQRAYIKERYAVRMQIQKSTNPDVITSPILQNLGEVDMGNYLTLQNFIEWGVQNFPAQHYMIIINAHGQGWYTNAKRKSRQARLAIGPDSYFNSEITSPELGAVMRNTARLIGQKIDIVYFDSCYMQDLETASEMADSVHLIIGSEDLVHSDEGLGIYGHSLAKLAQHPDAAAEQLSKIVVDDVVATFQTTPRKDEQLTISVIDADRLSALNTAMEKLSKNIRAIKSPEELQKIVTAQHKALTFNYNCDLLDFVKELQGADIRSLDKNILTEVEMSLNQAVIKKEINLYVGDAEDRKLRYQHAGGISVWHGINGDTNTFKNYHDLRFDRDTKWGATLEYLLSA